MTGTVLDHLDTENVARDFEQVRQAIGDDKFNYLGISYGSQIGYTYAELYPEKVGRMVLDSIVDHTVSGLYSVQSESTSLEATLHKFFDWCNKNNTCALHSQSDIVGFFKNLSSTAEKTPLPAPSCSQQGTNACRPDVDFGELIDSVHSGLMLENSPLGGWSQLAEHLLQASKGDAANLSAPFYTNETKSSTDWAFLAISCQDWENAASFRDLQNIEHIASLLSPITKGNSENLALFARCVGWPTKLTNPQRNLRSSIKRSPEILLVNSYWDPVTSVQFAASIREQIPNASLVFRNGSGHTSYVLGGEVAEAMNGFLVEGKMPPDGTVFAS